MQERQNKLVNQQGIFYGWKIVASLFVILTFTAGLGFYNHSVLLTALSTQAGFGLSTASTAVSVFFFVNGISGLVIGSLLEKYDVRLIIIVGAIVASASLLMIGQITKIWQLYLVYILFGFGFSASGLLPATTLVARWFHKNRARALSIASTGLSIGGVLITPVSASLVSEHGLAAASPWLGLLYFVGVVPLCLLLRSSPAEMGLQVDGEAVDEMRAARPDGMVFRSAIRSSYFWRLSIAYAFAMLAQVGAIAHQYGVISEQFSRAQSAYVIALLPLFSIIGRLAGGLIIDKFSTHKFTLIMMMTQGLALVLVAYSANNLLLMLGLALFGLTVGNLLMLQPLLIAEVFGLVSYSRIYSWSYMVSILGVASGPLLLGYLADTSGGYILPFGIASLSGFAACVIFFNAKSPAKDAL